MSESTFGERLRIAFDNANNATIARKIGVGPSTVVNYLAGRIPEWSIIFKIKGVTGCDLDWLLTGDESRNVKTPPIKKEIAERLAIIAHEQSNSVFGDLDIAGGNLDAQTMSLLVDLLLDRALASFNLVDGSLLTATEKKRAERFTFIANQPQSLEDRIGELVEKKLRVGTPFLLDREDALRDMIRELVKEEAANSRKRPVYPLRIADIDDDEITTRKAG